MQVIATSVIFLIFFFLIINFILLYISSDQSETTTVGTNVSVTSTVPSTTTTTLSKSMITNASFRTKKLPGSFISLPFFKIISKIIIGFLYNYQLYFVILRMKI